MNLNEKLRNQINIDIGLCDDQVTVNGSEALYNELIARYTILDPDFKKGLPTVGKATILGQEFDFRPELKAISAKLKMILMTNELEEEKVQNPQISKLLKLIEQGNKVGKEEYHPAENGFPFAYISGPQYAQWMSEINIFNERYLRNHPLYKSIHTTYFHKDTDSNAYDNMMGYLKALIVDEEFWTGSVEQLANVSKSQVYKHEERGVIMSKKKVFIVHGHDELAKVQMARFIEKLDLKAIILHEQPNSGRTIIEKIEANSDVQYAVVLYTPCDLGRAKEEDSTNEKYRARQNVVFEHGYLIGKLGRNKVSALVKGDIETPGDISGVVYTVMDEKGAWQTELIKDMKSAGLDCDVNNLF